MIHIHKLASGLPPPGPRPTEPLTLVLAEALVPFTQGELRRLSDGRREAFAVWAGRAQGDSAFISHFITLECPAERDRLTVPSAVRAELATGLRRDQLLVFADLHTHPEAAFLSDADRARPFSSRHGFYSMVIPEFAVGEPGQGWRAYQAACGEWEEVSCHDRFIPWPF